MRGLLIHGGRDNRTNRAFNDIHFYNLEHNEWLGVLCSGPGSEPRYGHVMFCQGSQILIFGGVNYRNFVSTKMMHYVELEQNKVLMHIRDQGRAPSVKSDRDEEQTSTKKVDYPNWWFTEIDEFDRDVIKLNHASP